MGRKLLGVFTLFGNGFGDGHLYGVRLRRMDWIRETISCVVAWVHSVSECGVWPSSVCFAATFPLGEGFGKRYITLIPCFIYQHL